MFFYPNRSQAIKIQKRLENIYKEVGGEFYAATDAWNYLKQRTDIDLKKIILDL